MSDTERTLSSPFCGMGQGGGRLLALTIIWHPDASRIGDQFLGSDGADRIRLARYEPLFYQPGSDGLALTHPGISRDPLQIMREPDDSVLIFPSASKMVVELNGKIIRETMHLTMAQIDAGVVLCLGGAVVLCLRYMQRLPKNNPVAGIDGVGEAAISVRDQILQVARTDSTVLLLGETGTGKEMVARALHALSKRSAAVMVSVNMAALNESLASADLFGAVKGAYTGANFVRHGFFSEAGGGTLFLDEIGNAPQTVQPMLLRVLESGQYRPLGATQDQFSTARLIAATDQDLYGGSFNQALLRRLESFIIEIPPLRMRREDIGVLILAILRKSNHASHTDLPTILINRFANYDWPGNIRQLTHILKRCLILLQSGEVPQFEQLLAQTPGAPVQSGPGTGSWKATSSEKRVNLDHFDMNQVLTAMEQHYWQISAAAHALHLSRPSMYKLLANHPLIRDVEQIPTEEIRSALAACGGNMAACASRLKTPVEALRRHVRAAGLLAS